MMADYEAREPAPPGAQGPRRAASRWTTSAPAIRRWATSAASRSTSLKMDRSFLAEQRHARGLGPRRRDHRARQDPRPAGRGRGHRDAKSSTRRCASSAATIGQGFFIARPMALAATRAWLVDAERSARRADADAGVARRGYADRLAMRGCRALAVSREVAARRADAVRWTSTEGGVDGDRLVHVRQAVRAASSRRASAREAARAAGLAR